RRDGAIPGTVLAIVAPVVAGRQKDTGLDVGGVVERGAARTAELEAIERTEVARGAGEGVLGRQREASEDDGGFGGSGWGGGGGGEEGAGLQQVGDLLAAAGAHQGTVAGRQRVPVRIDVEAADADVDQRLALVAVDR